jgi:hypothetical protein
MKSKSEKQLKKKNSISQSNIAKSKIICDKLLKIRITKNQKQFLFYISKGNESIQTTYKKILKTKKSYAPKIIKMD